MSKKIFFPLHLDGGNRGCEGITKGTAKILGEPKENLLCLSTNITLDRKLGICEYVDLREKKGLSLITKLRKKIDILLERDPYMKNFITTKYDYSKFFDCFTKDDIMFSTGGDMLCYNDNVVNYTNDYLHDKGIRTVLWGCSMGKENLTKDKMTTLQNFTMIYARESLTYDFFLSLGLKNVVCYPDPAFVLEPETTTLPRNIQGKEYIGFNVSNYTIGAFHLNTSFGDQVKKCLDYIINATDYHILLVPHVTWVKQNDNIIANYIFNEYNNKYPGRLSILNIANLNYLQIRYIISKAKFFIGSRTHAVISAYSCCVPSIAIGYSVKSKGIAKDLGIPQELVVDSKSVGKGLTLLESFKYLEANNNLIKNLLQKNMPNYREQTFNMRNIINNL